jgi:hypothetical protein
VRALPVLVLAAGLMLLTVSSRAAEGDLKGLVESYIKARDAGALGALAARALTEPTRPTASPTPRPAVSIVLLPYSEAFEAELDRVKSGLRDSGDAYIRAVGRIEAARVDYERALLAADGGELVRTETTDAQGAAHLRDLPAGEWLLLAWQESGHTAKKFKLRDQDAKKYPNVPTNVTYSIVTYWRTRVAVRRGETVEVPVTDRNAWMTAPRQEGGTPVPPRGSPGSQKRR